MLRESLKTELQEDIERLYLSQQQDWPEFAETVKALKKVRYRTVQVDGRIMRLQLNPRRMINALAPSGTEEVTLRPCFLCKQNRPPEQQDISFGKRWQAVFNPFPLTERHLVVISRDHTPQAVAGGTLGAMLRLSASTGFTTLYNGPACGASAPDHLHFQAFPPGNLPLERQVPHEASTSKDRIFFDDRLPRRIFLKAESPQRTEELFSHLVETWNRMAGNPPEKEPDMNLAVIPTNDKTENTDSPLVVVHPRSRHRPAVYYKQGAERMLVSPGAADMAGLVIVPRKVDFQKLDGWNLKRIMEEVCLGRKLFKRIVAEIK